jgi:hypothetical protein
MLEIEPVEITFWRLMLWLLDIVLWLLCCPVYLAIWLYRWVTGKSLRVRIWMFTGYN